MIARISLGRVYFRMYLSGNAFIAWMYLCGNAFIARMYLGGNRFGTRINLSGDAFNDRATDLRNYRFNHWIDDRCDGYNDGNASKERQ